MEPLQTESEENDTPLLAEEPFDERLWEPVGDQDEPDLPDPLSEDEEEPVESPWLPVSDADDDDTAPVNAEPDEEAVPDPWGPLDGVADPLAALPKPPPPVVVPATLLMPPMHEWGNSRDMTRKLPWRSTALIRQPKLGELVCIADPSCADSQLLVATWQWSDSEQCRELIFRVADDGPEHQVEAVRSGEPLIECELELAEETLVARLQLVSSRGERGLRLGRDLLGRRFLIDPSSDDFDAG